MIIKKIYLFFFIITLITFSYKNIFAAPLCLEEDINLENKEVTSNEESSKENIKSIENKDNEEKEKKKKEQSKEIEISAAVSYTHLTLPTKA